MHFDDEYHTSLFNHNEDLINIFLDRYVRSQFRISDQSAIVPPLISLTQNTLLCLVNPIKHINLKYIPNYTFVGKKITFDSSHVQFTLAFNTWNNALQSESLKRFRFFTMLWVSSNQIHELMHACTSLPISTATLPLFRKFVRLVRFIIWIWPQSRSVASIGFIPSAGAGNTR